MKANIIASFASFLLLTWSSESARADWVPTSGGTYDYGTLSNWEGGTVNNVFLSSDYSGASQTVTIDSDGVWNATNDIRTAHANGTTLLLRGEGGDRSLALGGDVSFVFPGTTGNNTLQFGTVNANQGIGFSLSGLRMINVDSPQLGDARVLFNGVLSGSGGLVKNGDGFLYLQNAASTFTGNLEVTGGQVILAGSGATLATENIVVGRQNEVFGYTLERAGTQGGMVLGNNTTPAGTSSGSLGANANRIPDSATVELQGGGLRLEAQSGDGNSLTETVGTVNLTRGQGDLVVWQAGSGNNVATLHVNNLNRSTGAVLGGYGANSIGNGKGTLGTGAALEGRITINTINGSSANGSVVNGIIPWAVNGAQQGGLYWHASVPSDFLTYGANGLTPQTSFVSDINTASATENVKISAASPTLEADTTINSLTLVTSGLSGVGKTLTLTAGALNVRRDNPAGGRMSVSADFNFNGREGFIFVNNGMDLLLDGVLSNTGGNGITITGYGSNQTRDRSRLTIVPGNTYTGPTTINGVYVIAQNKALPSSTALVVNEGGVLNTSWGGNPTVGSLAGYGIVDIDYNTTFHVGGDNTSTTFAGILQEGPYGTGNGGVTKNGTGTLTLTGMNTYGGATTVAAGGLVIHGSLSASANAVTVQNSTFLGGTGTIGRDVTVNSGGRLTGGLTNVVGTLNIASNLNLKAGAILDVQLVGGGVCDLIMVAGSVNLNSGGGAGSTLQLSAVGTLKGGETYTIMRAGSAIATTFANASSLTADGYKLVVDYAGGTGNDIVLSVLPKGTVVAIR